VLQEIRESIPKVEGTGFCKVLSALEFNPFEDSIREKFESEFQRGAQTYDQGGVPHVKFTKDGNTWQFPAEVFSGFVSELGTVEGLRKQLGVVGHNFANQLSLLLNGNERLNLLNATSREDLRGEMRSTLGVLFQSDDKRKEVQRIVREAFGWQLVIDVTGREQFRAAVSDVEPPSGIERSLATEALKYFSECADISSMSDGIRAYAGMIAAVMASEARLILIDEPEAFLHPALCMNLANNLSRKARETGRQLIVATHSAPFLLGCVQAAVDFNVVRLTYRNGLATSRIIEHRELVPLMRNPLLRSIGALNGVFFESVIVTEAARDRAFYEEVNHRCLVFKHEGGIPDCLFLNAQNWQTTRIIGPLRKIGIAAAAIVDVDIVCEEATTAFGHLLESANVPDVTRAGLSQMRGQIRPQTEDAKKALKRQGIGALSGEARHALEDFIGQLEKYGVFVVPCGQVECWLPHLRKSSSHKSEWLEEVFEAMGEDVEAESYVKPAANDVWQFMARIRCWLHDPKRRGIPSS
jgi:ABC-type uncharacterized transport system YnjBCD ATPase subunit